MARFEPITRRSFIADLGRATLGIVVLGAAACARDPDDAAQPSGEPTPPPDVTPDLSGAIDLQGWHRVNLGMVSAYILVRSGEAFVVDTGVAGKAADIENVLSEAGSKWNAVGHVILTHKHPDHIGSAGDVVDKATEAMVYAGEEDIPSIKVSRDITAVADGDDVGGLRIVGTPGHTPGHVSVYDATAKVFVSGDAMVNQDGAVAPPGEQFTEDMDEAMRSIAKVAELDFDIALFGHGDPITADAAAKVAALVDA